MGRSPSGKSRKAWRAVDEVETSGQSVTPLHLDINLDKFTERAHEVNSAAVVKKVEVRKNVAFDVALGRVSLLKDVKFKNRWYGQERVDEPVAEFDNMVHARGIASDLAAIFKAYPGESQLIRLRKPQAPGAYTAEREAWMQSFAVNQGERLKALMGEFGVPTNSIKVGVEFAGPNAPAGMFYLQVPARSFAENKQNREAQCMDQTKVICKRSNITFDYETGKCSPLKELSWKSRYCGDDRMEDPSAELGDVEEATKILNDMAAVWQIWQVPATVFADVNDMGTGNEKMEEWFRNLGRNRATFVQRALQDLGVPKGQLESMVNGDKPQAPQQEQTKEKPERARSADPHVLACACSGPPSPDSKNPTVQTQKMKIKARLQKAAVMHRVEDIPNLEAALEEARKMRLEEQWSRVDSLISDAENNLKTLYQRRRRQQAWEISKDRNTALSKVNVSKATQSGMAAVALPVQAF